MLMKVVTECTIKQTRVEEQTKDRAAASRWTKVHLFEVHFCEAAAYVSLQEQYYSSQLYSFSE
jgi:hypothetical protein